MPRAGAARRLGTTRCRVEEVCTWLISPSPDTLDRCCGELETAISEMAGTVSCLETGSGDAEALAEAWHLQRAVRKASRLLESAAHFHARWAHRLGTMTGGYRPGGEPAPTPHSGRIWLQA